jgi:uncharacterized protein (DUF305 family)
VRKLVALFVLVLMTSCSASTSSNDDFSANDIMFAQMMIPHHEQAIEMSDLALQNSTNPEIRDLATKIKGEQAPEIELMESWTDSHMGSHMDSHAGHMMDGMLSEEEMDELKSARGVEFDRLFLEGMIKHHKGAIDMADDVDDSKNPDVAKLAQSILITQRAEIELMKELLQRL